MSDEKKFKLISFSVSTVVTLLVLLILLFCGFKYQNPPPPAKKIIMVELTEMGGGGGGGNEAPAKTKSQPSASENIATQNAVEAQEVYTNPNVKKNSNNNSVNTPKPDQNAMFRPGKGGGTGGGNGTGSGPGTGSGIGPGKGAGSGGGIGVGYGSRGMVKIPDLTIKEEGKVYVEVHVSEDGTVLDAKVISSQKYPTSITSAVIRNECIQRAKQAKYVKGKEELRIIVFEP